MAAAVDVDVAVEVDEVDEQFEADDADEAGRVPGGVGAGATGEHRQLAGDQRLPALPPAHAPVMNSTLRPPSPGIATWEVTLSAPKVVPCVCYASVTACNWYYCAQPIAKPKAACALRFSWTVTSGNLGL